MDFDEYEKLAMRTDNQVGDAEKMLTIAALGIASEAGEVSGILKKYLHQGHPLDREDLKKELGDVFWYIAMACKYGGFSMEEVAETNISKLERLYPEGFDAKRSMGRYKTHDVSSGRCTFDE